MNIRLEFSYPEDEDNLKKFVQAVGGREWVGLTSEEVDDIVENAIDKVDAMIQTMDKLKEKNT